MSLKDLLKKSVYDQYIASASDINVRLILITLVIVSLLALFMILIYKYTYRGAIFSFEFATSLVLTALVTSLVILPISTNLTLSLGMVGALSIVRFRTAVKSAKDISYMFWAIAIGITCGAGFYLIAIAGTAFIAIIMVIMMLAVNRKFNSEPCLAVFRLQNNADTDSIKSYFNKIIFKSLVVNAEYVEITAELNNIPSAKVINKLKQDKNIVDMSFVKYNGDYSI